METGIYDTLCSFYSLSRQFLNPITGKLWGPNNAAVPFIGEDGQEYYDHESLRQANKEWKARTYVKIPTRQI